MEAEFFSSLDSWEVISLFVSFLVVSIAIYRWLMVRWQSDVNLKKYVFIHGMPSSKMEGPFDVQLDVPVDQTVVLTIARDGKVLRTIHDGPMPAGSQSLSVDCKGLEVGRYSLKMNTEGQEDIKMFDWMGD